MRLLDFFQAMAIARAKVQDFEDRMQLVWEAYVSSSEPKGRASKHAPESPNTAKMAVALEEQFRLSRDSAALVEPEVCRLCRYYKAEQFGYPIFALACAHLFFPSTESEEMFVWHWANRFAEFAAYDKDNSNFLDRGEFRRMISELLPAGHDVDRALQDIDEQFRTIDVDQDQRISFQEYALWRELADEVGVLPKTWTTKLRSLLSAKKTLSAMQSPATSFAPSPARSPAMSPRAMVASLSQSMSQSTTLEPRTFLLKQ